MNVILDNIIFSLQKAGGISVYWNELLKRIEKQDGVHIEMFGTESSNLFGKKYIDYQKKETILPLKIVRYLKFQRNIEEKAIFHSSYYRYAKGKNVLNITTVHDFTYEYFRKGIARFIHSWQKRRALNKSDGIICISHNTKKDLLKFYPELSKKKIRVIYNGVNEIFDKEIPIDIENQLKGKKYILYVGDRKSKYKNFEKVIELIKNIEREYELVLIGGGQITSEESKKIYVIKERVTQLIDVDETELNTLYRNAFCLLYPSSYEGFGIPVVEAMRAGCPVIAVNNSSIPEVSGDGVLLTNTPDVSEFMSCLKILEQENIRKEIIEKAYTHSKKFSWDRCYQQTVEFYKEIYNENINNNSHLQ